MSKTQSELEQEGWAFQSEEIEDSPKSSIIYLRVRPEMHSGAVMLSAIGSLSVCACMIDGLGLVYAPIYSISEDHAALKGLTIATGLKFSHPDGSGRMKLSAIETPADVNSIMSEIIGKPYNIEEYCEVITEEEFYAI